MEMQECGEGSLGTEYVSFLLLFSNSHLYSLGLVFLLLEDVVSHPGASERSCKEGGLRASVGMLCGAGEPFFSHISPFRCRDGKSSWLAGRGADGRWTREEKRLDCVQKHRSPKGESGPSESGWGRPPQRPWGECVGLWAWLDPLPPPRSGGRH